MCIQCMNAATNTTEEISGIMQHTVHGKFKEIIKFHNCYVLFDVYKMNFACIMSIMQLKSTWKDINGLIMSHWINISLLLCCHVTIQL